MSQRPSSIQLVVDALRDRSSFLIAGHVNPDGDCLGCICALGLTLRRMGKQVALVCPDGVPYLYAFMPESERVLKEPPPDQHFEVAIAVDCEDLSRLGAAETAVRSCDLLIEIDHHPGEQRDGHLQLVWPHAAAAGEIVYELLRQAEVKIDSAIAECLLTAIVTDTGSFRFSNVKPATLRVAASLMEAGASHTKIAHNVYESRSFSSTKLLGMALSTLRSTAGGRIAWATITRDQLEQSKATEAETEGIVNYVRSVRGAQVGLLFREGPDGTTRVSLRSREGLDIGQVARLFGGGGHKTAAGCTVERPLAEAQDLVIDAVCKWMGS